MKVKISNMACGHCRLKIESELRSAGFNYIDFDMFHDVVELKENEGSFLTAKKAISKAGYLVDEEYVERSEKIKVYVYCSVAELVEATSTIGAEVDSFIEGNAIIHYSDDKSDILEVLDAFGIEYQA